MKIKHVLNEGISKDVDDRFSSIFLLSKKGHYLALSANPSISVSNYFGWMNFSGGDNGHDYDMYKSVDNIFLDDNNMLVPNEIINRFNSIDRIYGDASNNSTVERFRIVRNGLIYDIMPDRQMHVNIELDFRPIHDYDDQGRIYKMYKEKLPLKKSSKDIIVIEYDKYSDGSLRDLKSRHYLFIFGVDDAFEFRNEWHKKNYEYDSSRGARSEFYVHNGLRFVVKKETSLILTFSSDKDDAREKLLDILDNNKMITDVHNKYFDNYLTKKFGISELTGRDTAFGYVNAIHAFDGLCVNLQYNKENIQGIWAGLPWFYQFWARDELISLKALILEDKIDLAKQILFRHISRISIDGRLPNMWPESRLGSADAIGWLYRRIYDMISMLEEKDSLGEYFSLYDLKYVRERLQYSITQMMKNYYENGLIRNNALETWMDTSFRGNVETDFREGYRIEIQCGFLGMLKLMNMLNNMLANKLVKKNDKLIKITDNQYDYRKLERDMASTVREKFFFQGFLNDGYASGLSDVTRPNIFIAYYLYPELLHHEEWEKIFDNALERLWCNWILEQDHEVGGLSTIDKTNPLYHPNYSGMSNQSYHRGDSWFFINNIAAISLYQLNKEKYFPSVKKILDASTEDMLFRGFIGYSSELSSSSALKPGGCFCQAWSLATYIELIHEVFM